MSDPAVSENPPPVSREGWATLFSFIFKCLILGALVGFVYVFSQPIGALLQNTASIKYDKLEVSVQLTDDSREVLNALLAVIKVTPDWDDAQKITALEQLLYRYERFIEATIISEKTGGASRTGYDRAFLQLLDGDVAAARSTLDELYARHPTLWNIDEIRRMLAALPASPSAEQFQALYADIAAYCSWGADPALVQRMRDAAGPVRAAPRKGCGQ